MEEIPAFWAGAQDHALGVVNVRELAEAAGGWRALKEGGEAALVDAGLSPIIARAWLRTPPRITRGTAITLEDPRYPDGLRTTEFPPPVLCVDGDPDALQPQAKSVAVVGTRRCTGYGLSIAQSLAAGLAAGGITVVSGLARGIDAAAHKGALRAGRTVAVLGHGLAHTAPPSNRYLRRDIVENGGAVISVWTDGFEPRPHLFLIRNAWVAGLARAVIVVEAPVRSGALATARLAGVLGRDVYAVPGPLGAPASRGCHQLMNDSPTKVVVDIDELVAELCARAPQRPSDWLARLFAGGSLDEAARVAGRSAAELLADLSRMEVQGSVVRLPGQRYAPGENPA